MKNTFQSKLSILHIIICSFTGVCLILPLFLLTSPYFIASDNIPTVPKNISDAVLEYDGTVEEIQLPCKISDLSDRTPVTVTFSISPKATDYLYFRSVYSPLKIYIDNNLWYQYGAEGSYPSFFADPPAMASHIALPSSDSPITVRMEYLSPSVRNTLSIYAPILGSETDIISYLTKQHGVSLMLSIFFILVGLFLILLSFFFLSFELNGQKCRAPGFFALTVGMWGFCENTITVYFLPNPSILYLFSFIGLFCINIPICTFSSVIVKDTNQFLPKTIRFITELFVAISLFLQFTGILQFSQSVFLFHIVIPLVLTTNLGYLIYFFTKDKDKNVLILIGGYIILLLSSILELENYYIKFHTGYSSIFQVGSFIFAFFCLMSAGFSMRQIFQKSIQAVILQQEMRFIEESIEIQKKRNQMLISHETEFRRQRHDMRHQLVMIRNLASSNNIDQLTDYIDQQINAIPSAQAQIFCENQVANAMIIHYVSLAKEQGIDIQVQVDIPVRTNNINEGTLCILIGNLLENALEACTRIKASEQMRYIRFSTSLQGEMLYITMENSFNGMYQIINNHFISSKRENRAGIGLSSIASIAEKYDGTARFTPLKTSFLSEVNIRL